MPFVIEVFESDLYRPDRGRWVPLRNPHGTKEIRTFPSERIVRAYVKKHAIDVVCRYRIKEINDLHG